MIHCLSAIHISRGSPSHACPPAARQTPWASGSDFQTRLQLKDSFNVIEPHWGESEGLIFFLSRRLLLKGIFQHLHSKTVVRGVFNKIQDHVKN